MKPYDPKRTMFILFNIKNQILLREEIVLCTDTRYIYGTVCLHMCRQINRSMFLLIFIRSLDLTKSPSKYVNSYIFLFR